MVGDLDRVEGGWQRRKVVDQVQPLNSLVGTDVQQSCGATPKALVAFFSEDRRLNIRG